MPLHGFSYDDRKKPITGADGNGRVVGEQVARKAAEKRPGSGEK
jgi:hypothetical protein